MNAKEISDATLPTVTPADDDLMILYDVSEGTTGKAPISGIAPKVAENIDISTLVGDTSNIIEESALSNLGPAAGATQHDVNVAIDSVISDIQNTHLVSVLPSDINTSFPISFTTDVTIDGVTIPQYSRGYFCAVIDAMAVLVDPDGYIYTCYRNTNTWNKCITNKPKWIQFGEVADLNFRSAFQNIWNAATDYSLVSIANSAGSEGSVFIQKKPGTNRTYGFFSCSTGNYELLHDADGWMVRKITL